MWGLSTCVDLYNCNYRIKHADEIERYVVELCDLIDMKRFGPCNVIHFGEDPKNWRILYDAIDRNVFNLRSLCKQNVNQHI